MPDAASDTRRATLALFLMAALGVALVFLFPGNPEEDTLYHYLQARTAWSNHDYFIGVWSRPFFTAVFALPDLIGFTAGRLFGVAIGVATAWQTWRLAYDLELRRTWLVIPFLLAQPVFFELFPDMLTEPLFGLLFILAVRCHLRRWVKLGMLVASFLPLARPEGFFLGILWGVWVLVDAAHKRDYSRLLLAKILRAIPSTLLLATGTVLWWAAAYWVSGDPLYIERHWPSQWHQDMYGHGTIFSYAGRGWEFTGLLFIPFLTGLCLALFSRTRSWLVISSAFLLLFVLHSIFRLYGLFGEAGYPRYMVTVSSVIAVLTLRGWNEIGDLFDLGSRRVRTRLAWVVLSLAIASSFVYLDCLYWARSAIAINEMAGWLRGHPVPHTRLVWSNARMCIDLGETLDSSPALDTKGEATAALLRAEPAGTLVFWEDHLGPDWFGMTAADIEKCGYQVVRDQHYSLRGIIGIDPYGRRTPNFDIEVTLLLKP